MAISYSGITNYGKVTLPSVDTWGSDMNILRDPPKSIMTRRVDKVGQTSSITEMIDESENRAAECILPFARGVNPSVSVSYSNSSNNGGQLSSGIRNNSDGNYGTNGNGSNVNNYTAGAAASLPYKLTDSFRPPVLSQWDLQPLSRLPRVWTSSFTKPGFSDFSKKARSCGTDLETKEVKNNVLKTSARPTAVYKIETPLKEQPFEVKYFIQPSLKKSYQAPKTSTDRTQQTVLQPNKEINNNVLHAFANSNLKNIKHVNNNDFNTEKYINDKNNTSAFTNIKSNYTQIGSIEDIMDSSNIRTKDVLNGNYSTNFRGNDKIDYIHNDIELSRVLPEYQTTTNIKQNQEKRIEHEYMKELERNTPLTNMYVNSSKQGDYNISSREYQLNPKISAGGFDIPSQIPNQNRIGNISAPFETEKSKLGRSVMQQFEGRYMH